MFHDVKYPHRPTQLEVVLQGQHHLLLPGLEGGLPQEWAGGTPEGVPLVAAPTGRLRDRLVPAAHLHRGHALRCLQLGQT